MWFNKVARPTNQRRVPPVKTIIQEIFAVYQTQIMELFSSSEPVALRRVEAEGLRLLKAMMLEMLVAYTKELTANILSDKKSRRQAGLVLERKGDARSILTQLGEFLYHRDYYYDHRAGCYRYLVDEILGITKGQRVSSEVGLALAGAAAEMSYEKSSRYVSEGEVSRQAVMNKVRGSQPKRQAPTEKKCVAVLHVDADEDHVTLTGGRKSIVPLVSVYEGIGQQGKRRYCKEVFHVSEYGLEADQLWDRVLSEIENRYDLEGTAIYLHGDGAGWVKTGMEWLPNCRFVLDKYHKNKEVKKMSAGLAPAIRRDVEDGIRESLHWEDDGFFNDITESLCKETPEREKKIREAARYLRNHREGIRICAIDPEANNGGCTEPHVSHVLSSRLSDRPRTWSKTTLASLAPILAAKGELEEKRPPTPQMLPILKNAAAKARRAFKPKHTLGLVEPDAVGTLTAITMGKKSPTFRAVYSFTR